MGRVYKNVLITGGSGFIGAAIVESFVNDGVNVKVFDDNSRGSLRRLAHIQNKVTFIEGDIRDAAAVRIALKGIDLVVHLAAVNGTKFFYQVPELVLEVGVKGILNVMDACELEGVRELIVASSSEVYQTPPSVPTAEDVPALIPDVTNPRYSYAGSKLITELLTLHYGNKYLDRAILFRPHNVYGPDMGWEHVIPDFVCKMLDEKKKAGSDTFDFVIQGDGLQTRAFVHIKDFIAGLRCVIESGEHLNIYHIGNPEEINIRDLAMKVAEYLELSITIVPGPTAPGGTNRRCPDISKLINFNYAPKTSIETGLASTVKWYAENQNLRV